jgi:hypothetical protein
MCGGGANRQHLLKIMNGELNFKVENLKQLHHFVID